MPPISVCGQPTGDVCWPNLRRSRVLLTGVSALALSLSPSPCCSLRPERLHRPARCRAPQRQLRRSGSGVRFAQRDRRPGATTSSAPTCCPRHNRWTSRSATSTAPVHHITNVGEDLSLRLAIAMPPAVHYFHPCEQCGYTDEGPPPSGNQAHRPRARDPRFGPELSRRRSRRRPTLHPFISSRAQAAWIHNLEEPCARSSRSSQGVRENARGGLFRKLSVARG
jgi:hypothetical protein